MVKIKAVILKHDIQKNIPLKDYTTFKVGGPAKFFVEIDHANEIAFDSQAIDKLATQDLLKLVQKLPDGYRTVFNLYAIEGYNHKEISEELGISVGTSKSNLSRARGILQEKIKNIYGSAIVR